MKHISIVLATGFVQLGFVAVAQEYDDMYFRAKDREKARAASSQPSYTSNYENFKKKHFGDATHEEIINPTESYSARQINPEYVAQANVEQEQGDSADYFVENYQYQNQANPTDSWSSPGYYGPQINNWNSPYYGYDRWNSPWSNPYWGAGSGWSSSYSFYYGNQWGYACDPYRFNNFGWNNYYDPFWGPSYGWSPGWNFSMNFMWGNGWGNYWNNGWGRPVYVYEGRVPNYGKRPSRAPSAVTSAENRIRTRPTATQPADGGFTEGRVRSNTNTNREYYNRTWKRDQQRSNWSNNSYKPRERDANFNNQQQNRPSREYNFQSRERTYSPPSRSFNSGGGSRPSGGSSSGSRARTRN